MLGATMQPRWWIALGLLLAAALAPGSRPRPTAAVIVTCAWPIQLEDRVPPPLPTHRGCRQLPEADMEWITEC